MLRPGWAAFDLAVGGRSLEAMSLQRPEPDRHPSSVADERRRVRRAAVSPSAAVVTAAGAGIGVLIDPHTFVLAVILGAGAWLGRMGVAVFGSWRRRLPTVDIDPYAVPEPWRQYVRQALNARQRFDQTLTQWSAGPLRDRLALLQPQLSRGAEEVWAVARQGAILEGGAAGVSAGGGNRPSTDKLSAELRQVQAEQRRAGPDAAGRQASLTRTEEAIAAQLRAAAQSQEATAEVLDRLRVLTARLDEAVTQLLSLGLEQVSGAGEGSADAVAGSVDALVEEIAALHQGLREAGAASAGPSGGDSWNGPAVLPAATPPAQLSSPAPESPSLAVGPAGPEAEAPSPAAEPPSSPATS
jgi:hypothetical protein